MSDIRDRLIQSRDFIGTNRYYEFMLTYGRDYVIGPDTFKGERGEQHNCFGNSTHLAIEDSSLTYVEGKVSVHGVDLDHAWCVTAEGIVVDPTIIDKGQVLGYFGVPFMTEYLKAAVITNNYYGLIDYFTARKTVPKLFELGLETGQAWLIYKHRGKW